jgi:adenylate kinase family enzyme
MDLTRTLVMGCSGSGKSTFARALAQRTGLPLVHLDQEYWSPGWVERYALPDWLDRVAELAQGERWIIDGNYSNSLPLRLPRATAVLWLDLPRWLCLSSTILRCLAGYGRSRPDMAPGCVEQWDWAFYLFIWNWFKRSRPRVIRLLSQPEYAPLVQRFRTRRAAWEWLEATPASATAS